MSRKEEFTTTQAEDLVKLSYGVQARDFAAVKGQQFCASVLLII